MSDSASPRTTGSPPLRVVVATGIFPPDIGGPATHAADLADELRARGHTVIVLTATDARERSQDEHEVKIPRRWPWWMRDATVARWLRRNRSRYDVVYAAGMHHSAVAGARMAQRPVIVKMVADTAWERARRRGLTTAGFSEFQRDRRPGARVRLMRAIRNWSVRRATAIVVPSNTLKPVVEGWLGSGDRLDVRVIPNGVRVAGESVQPNVRDDELRAVFVGRLIDLKRVDLLIDAVCSTPGVRLEIIGDGPLRVALEEHAQGTSMSERISFVGSLPHDEVQRRIARSDVLLLASTHEGLPHVAIEALVSGTPVVASRAGGTPEIVADGRNGILVDPPTVESFAATLSRLRADPDELERLREGALVDGELWRFDRVTEAVERLVREVLDPIPKPVAVFVGKGGIPSGPTPAWHRKLDVLARHLDSTIVSPAPPGPGRVLGVSLRRFPIFRPRPVASALFYGGGAAIGIGIAARRQGAVVCQSPFEAAVCLAMRRALPRRRRPRLVLEVHGDWRTAARLYGSRSRRLLGPVSDNVARWAVRRADRLRAVGAFTEAIARDAGFVGEVDRFMAFSDWQRFAERAPVPPPDEPTVVFVGALEACKAPEILLEAWARVVRTLPQAHLALVGTGPMRSALVEQAARLDLDGTVEFCGAVPSHEVIDRLDRSMFMVLPSRSEGMPRVVLEAMARARAVVGARAGGTPELIEEGVTGLLVPPDEPELLADALLELLVDRERAVKMGQEGRRRAMLRDPVTEFDTGTARLAAWIALPCASPVG